MKVKTRVAIIEIWHLFGDPLLAWWIATWLSVSVQELSWLGNFGYWAWVGIIFLIQTVWGIDTTPRRTYGKDEDNYDRS